LHWAVKKGSIKITKLLIGLGADVDAQDIVMLVTNLPYFIEGWKNTFVLCDKK